MANILVIFFSLILGTGQPSVNATPEDQQDPVTTYYLIRHAEKDRSDASNKNPNLTNEGTERANKWAVILKDIEFDAIYSTDYNRTMQTAQPAATLNKLEVIKYDPKNLFDKEFEKSTTGKTVLVVGHSNTTPQLANAILGKKKYKDIDDSENGALFIVQILEDGTALSQVLYIN